MRLFGAGLRPELMTLKQCFMWADPYNKGYIDNTKNLRELFCCLGSIMDESKVARIYVDIDTDGNKLLSFPEFIEWALKRPPELGQGIDLPVGLDDDRTAYGHCKYAGCSCDGYTKDPRASAAMVAFCAC